MNLMWKCHLCVLPLLLCISSEHHGKIDLAHKKKVYTCDPSSAVVEARNAAINDGKKLTSSLFTCARSPTWFLIDLMVAFRIGCVHIDFILSSAYITKKSKAEAKTSILLKQYFDSNLVPNENKDDLCWVFEEKVIKFSGEVYCLKKLNGPHHRHVSMYNPTVLAINVSEVNVYEGCLDRFYGPGCEYICMCKENEPCHLITGVCSNGCEQGFHGKTCSQINLEDSRFHCYSLSQANETYNNCRIQCYQLNSDAFIIEKSECKCLSMDISLSYEFCNSLKNEAFSVCPRGYYGHKCTTRCICEEDDFCSIGNGSCYDAPRPLKVSDEANRGMGKVGWFVILFLIFLLAASIYFVVAVKDKFRFLSYLKKAKVSANKTSIKAQPNEQ